MLVNNAVSIDAKSGVDVCAWFVDDSNFSDIFDVDWFIKSVAPDVKVVKELPQNERKYLLKQLSSMRVPRKVTPHYYLTRILPSLKRKHVKVPLRFLFIRVSLFQADCVSGYSLCDLDFVYIDVYLSFEYEEFHALICRFVQLNQPLICFIALAPLYPLKSDM